MPAVADVTLLHSQETGPIRAWTLGESRQTYAKRIETLWLPDIRLSGDILIYTARGLIPAGQVRKGDWVGATHDFLDEHHPQLPRYLHGSTREVWWWIQHLFWGQPYKLIDMMDSHVSHFRSDHWCVDIREMYPWYRKMAHKGSDTLWLRVLEAGDSSMNLVQVNGSWRAYGVPISA